jgi:hypothetical protein
VSLERSGQRSNVSLPERVRVNALLQQPHHQGLIRQLEILFG